MFYFIQTFISLSYYTLHYNENCVKITRLKLVDALCISRKKISSDARLLSVFFFFFHSPLSFSYIVTGGQAASLLRHRFLGTGETHARVRIGTAPLTHDILSLLAKTNTFARN